MDLRKQLNHQIGVLPGKARKRLPMCQGHQLPDIIHEPFAPWLKIQTAGSPVSQII
jgi:hypothetical protein